MSISIDLLVRELRNLGHSVHVYTASHFTYRDPDPNTFRFFAIETPWTKGYPLAVPPFYPMLRKFRKHRYDIIHTHTPFTIGFVGLRWARSHEIPIVSTYHTLYDRYAHYIPMPRRYVRFKIAKHTNFYYNHVDSIITPSEAAAKWLRRHDVHTPIDVVPTGAPTRRLLDRSEVRHSLGISPHHRMLLYVGRLAQEKNLETLFAACARIFRNDPDARLFLVGDGPYREECNEIVRDLAIGDRVQFAGFVPRAEVDRFYSAADAFVFSSVTETQGLVVQEAMTYGLPGVVVAGGGAGAAIQDGENGFLVKNDAAELAEKTLELLSNDGLHSRLSEGARKTVAAYTTQDMARQVTTIYETVLEKDRLKPSVLA